MKDVIPYILSIQENQSTSFMKEMTLGGIFEMSELKLSIKKAADDDLDRIMEIYRYAQDFMIKSGNPSQWGHFYPKPELIRSDIEKKVCYVLFDETGIHGVFALFAGEEPAYQYIEKGEWLNDDPYVTIHRLAGDGQVRGLFRSTSDYCKSISSNIRVDTHADNHVMQRLIEKNGYRKCGIIYIADGSPRIAYHWDGNPGK